MAKVRLYPAGAGEPEAYTPGMPALQRVEAERAVREGFRCSFCGKAYSEVETMICGPTPAVAICDGCVELCTEIIAEGGGPTEGM